jgi:hypothetical protein
VSGFTQVCEELQIADHDVAMLAHGTLAKWFPA